MSPVSCLHVHCNCNQAGAVTLVLELLLQTHKLRTWLRPKLTQHQTRQTTIHLAEWQILGSKYLMLLATPFL